MPRHPYRLIFARNLSRLASLLTSLAFALVISLAQAGNFENSVVTIASLPSYKLQRDCAQGCLLYAGGYGYNINNLPTYLKCPGPLLNGCYCRADLSSSADFFISSCLTTQLCTNPVDVTSAIGVYGEYCASISSENAGIAQVAATTTDGGSVATTVIVTTATATGATPNSGSSESPSFGHFAAILSSAITILMFWL